MSEIFIFVLCFIWQVVRRGVRRGSPWTGPYVVHGPGPWWGSVDRGSVFSGYAILSTPLYGHWLSAHCLFSL